MRNKSSSSSLSSDSDSSDDLFEEEERLTRVKLVNKINDTIFEKEYTRLDLITGEIESEDLLGKKRA